MNPRLTGLLLLLALVPSAACDRPPEKVNIGVALTRNNMFGVELAVAQINAEGGIRGVPLRVVGTEMEDKSQFDAEVVLRRAKRLADDDDVIAIVGHDDSASTLSAAPLYNEKGIPHIVTIATHPAISAIGDWTYRMCLPDTVQAPALAEYAVRRWGKRRIMVLYVNDDYGRGLAEVFEERARALGASVLAGIFHRNLLEEEDRQLIGAALRRASESGEPPDLIVLFQRPPAAKWTLRAVREAGIQCDILASDSLATSRFISADPDLTEGVRLVQFYFPLPDNPHMMQFVRDFRDFAGSEPDYGQAFAYDAVYLLRDAVLNGGFSREGVKSYLDRVIREKTSVDGASGIYTISQSHDASRAFYLVEIRGGVQRVVETFLSATDTN